MFGYGFWADVFAFLQVLSGMLLVFIILLQRGKGGGLTGALGGMGGQSAFGPKADFQVIRFTIGIAAVWVLFNIGGIFMNRWNAQSYFADKGKPESVESAIPKAKSLTEEKGAASTVGATPETKGEADKAAEVKSEKTEESGVKAETKTAPAEKSATKDEPAESTPAPEKSKAEAPQAESPPEKKAE